MVERFNITAKKEYLFLLDFLINNKDLDFYYTKDNQRIYISNTYELKQLLRQATIVYSLKEKGDYVGLILIWKSKGGNVTRRYIKIIAKDENIADKLLTVLLWNNFFEFFVKINKHSRFLKAFSNKGFKFFGGRGSQLLLKRELKVGENKNVFE